MGKFTSNSSYKIIRITDDSSIPLSFETYYEWEKRNFDVVNIPNTDELNDLLCEYPDVDCIIVQFKNKTTAASVVETLNKNLTDYYKRRVYWYDDSGNHGIEIALALSKAELEHTRDPKFSIVTPLYKTKYENFVQAYTSLCHQTVNDWEWVLVDDSPEMLTNIKEFIDSQKDPRLRYYRIAPTNGNIGLSKWRGNCMSRGRWLIEFDHDDMLTYWCLDSISKAIEKYPNNKFVYSDNTTIDENGEVTPCRYGNNYEFGLGYGHSYQSKTPNKGITVRTDSSGPMNNACIRHIVGVPNHFRCWERDFYFSVGGHNQHVRIADDYELLVRSFLKTRFTHLMCCCYAQRFDGNNSQYVENTDSDGQGNINDIQRRVRLIAIHYDRQIHERLEELGLKDDEWIEGDPYQTAMKYEALHLPDVCEDQFNPFENKKFGVFFLATSVYKEYFTEFSKSLKNLFPNTDMEKHLVIMSDGLKEYDGKNLHGFETHVVDVIDYPYPIVPMNKFQMVAKYMKDYDLEYGMFFDADTIIFEKSDKFWNEMENRLASGKLICSGHPHYLYTPDRNMSEPFVIPRTDSCGYMTPDVLNQHKSYIITSFFAGNRNVIEKYAKKIKDMIGQDLSTIRWIPHYVDEAYMNTIYVKDVLLGHENDIIKEKFITINPYTFGDYPERDNGDVYKNNFPEYDDTIFMNQKFNTALKDRKKNNEI